MQNKSEKIGELAKALVHCQAQIKGALKDSANPFFKSKYADLESVWAACKDALGKNGLSVVQTMGMSEKFGPTLVTTLLHSSGEWIAGEAPVMAKSDTPQDLGSAYTYSRRYGLAAIVGVVQVDDDAESAMGRSAGQSSGQTQARTEQRTGAIGRDLERGPPPGRFDSSPPPDLRGAPPPGRR